MLPGLELQALCAGDPDHHSAVVILHGLGVSKEVQLPEIERLRGEGLFAIAIDAPHHGSRNDGIIDLFNQLNGSDRHHLLLAIILQQAAEVSALVELLRSEGKKVAVSGISMGGYTVFALLRMKNRPDLLAPFLSTPNFRTRDVEKPLPASLAEASGPADHCDEIFPASLFMITAGKDTVVNPASAREFYQKLKPLYKSCPEKLEYHEFPLSDHMMRPADWFSGWEKFLERLKREGF